MFAVSIPSVLTLYCALLGCAHTESDAASKTQCLSLTWLGDFHGTLARLLKVNLTQLLYDMTHKTGPATLIT